MEGLRRACGVLLTPPQIVFDLDQLPAESVLELRDSVLNLLVAFASGPRPIQTQLCVCLASLAIQMLAWKDVLATVGSALGNSAGDCVLEFLKILPEEVTEGHKINLSVCILDTSFWGIAIGLTENNLAGR